MQQIIIIIIILLSRHITLRIPLFSLHRACISKVTVISSRMNINNMQQKLYKA